MYFLAVEGTSLKIFLSPTRSKSLVARAANQFCNRLNVCFKSVVVLEKDALFKGVNHNARVNTNSIT